jgi:molybdate transport system substrate-binding protein
MRRIAVLLVASALCVAGCGSSPSKPSTTGGSGPVVVFAAASLKSAFTTLARQFETAHPDVRVVPSFGGSDSLAAQIVAGAPVDVFAAASSTTMSTVTKVGDADTPVEFARNQLEIVVAAGNPRQIAVLKDVAKPGVKLALCAHTVPCGAAADKALTAVNVTAHPVTLEQDVTSVLTKVELGEVDAGLVYRTDVKSAAGKVEGIDFAEAAQAVNSYPIAVLKTGKNAGMARAFVEFVLSPVGQQVLRAAGFQPAGVP